MQRAKLGDLIIDRGARSVLRGDETLQLNGLTFDFLMAMVDAAPNLASFDLLMEKVWRRQVVTPETMAQRASMLRRSLSPDGKGEGYFEAVRGIGYRLTAPVSDAMSAPVPSGSASLPIRTVQTIAVMPFENLSGDPEQDFFCDGLVEDITTALSHVRGLLVISRNSTFTFKGTTASVREITDRLNVGWLLVGSVRRAGDRVRVSVQLVDTATEQTHWSRKFDGRLEDVFDLQDDLTTEIARELDIELVSGEEGRRRHLRHGSPQSAEILYKGIYHHYAYDRTSFDMALDCFEAFIRREPDSMNGYIWKAMAYGFAVVVQWVDPQSAVPVLLSCAGKIAEIDRNDPQAHLAQAYASVFSGKVLEALNAAESASKAAPNLDEAWFMTSWLQMMAGEPEKSITSMTRAIRLSPVVPATRLGVLATAYRNAGRFEESIQVFQSVIENYPDFVWAHTGLATTYGLAGNDRAAAHEVEIALKMDPTYTVERFTTPDLYLDKSVMQASAAVLRKAGMPSNSG